MATRTGEKLLYEDISYIIRGACFELYKKFGGDFKESMINKALVKELEYKGLKVNSQKKINIFHRDEKIGVYVPDIIVEDKILIELKVKPFLTKEDDRQFWRYLESARYKLGFLINFGSRKLEIKRRIYDKARKSEFASIRFYNSTDPRQSASKNMGFIAITTSIILSLLICI